MIEEQPIEQPMSSPSPRARVRARPRKPAPRSIMSNPASDPRARVVDATTQSTSLEQRLEAQESASARMLAMLEDLTQARAQSQFVESQPPPEPLIREADDEELTDWLRDLRRQTNPLPRTGNPRPEPDRNHPPRWYMKQDGSVVALQGSPQARAYYQNMGYRLLTEEEGEYWVKVEHPKVVVLQREKAHLITTLRRTRDLDPALKASLDPSWDTDLDHMTIPELRGQLEWLANQPMADGRPRRVLERLPRLVDADSRRAEAEGARLMQGVETENDVTPEQLASKLERARAQGRLIEGTPGPRRFN